jgi:hypothetical protein
MNLPRGFSDWRRRQSGLAAAAIRVASDGSNQSHAVTHACEAVTVRYCFGPTWEWAWGLPHARERIEETRRTSDDRVGTSSSFFSFFYIFYLYPVPMTCGPQGGRWTTLTTLWVRPWSVWRSHPSCIRSWFVLITFKFSESSKEVRPESIEAFGYTSL